MKLVHFMGEPTSHTSIVPDIARKHIPQWYKKSEVEYRDSNNILTAGLKKCVPFLDALMAGYFLFTSINIYVERDLDGNLLIKYDDELIQDMQPILNRPHESGSLMPRPAGHLQDHLIWTANWGWKTPKGYSMLVTHPLNRFDLPFTTMSAIIDSDKFYGSGNIPFFIKDNFEGVIPKGTPFAQLIPIKRKRWFASIAPRMVNLSLDNGAYGINGVYKQEMWQKKDYSIGDYNEK